jgi:hypothetical protein
MENSISPSAANLAARSTTGSRFGLMTIDAPSLRRRTSRLGGTLSKLREQDGRANIFAPQIADDDDVLHMDRAESPRSIRPGRGRTQLERSEANCSEFRLQPVWGTA